VLAVLAVILPCQGVAQAQIIELRQVGDKTIACGRSGLFSDLKDCGTQADWYSYVFVGSISAITPAENDEKELQLVPEETFLGVPPASVTVLTLSGECLGELKVGDRWLFYLRKVNTSPITLEYGGNSRPLADAGEEVETLRRLKTIGNLAIVRGEVMQGRWENGEPVPQAKVTAHRVSDGLTFVSTTDPAGHYEFQPLPSGDYKILVDPVGSFQADDGELNAGPATRSDLLISRSPHAQIAGRVTRSNGSAVPELPVAVLNLDGTMYATGLTYQDGHFAFDSLGPGEFVVRLELPADANWLGSADSDASRESLPASMFYPGVPNRTDAGVIRLTTDEKRDDINFVLPSP
jgi:hypothetical protein